VVVATSTYPLLWMIVHIPFLLGPFLLGPIVRLLSSCLPFILECLSFLHSLSLLHDCILYHSSMIGGDWGRTYFGIVHTSPSFTSFTFFGGYVMIRWEPVLHSLQISGFSEYQQAYLCLLSYRVSLRVLRVLDRLSSISSHRYLPLLPCLLDVVSNGPNIVIVVQHRPP
jgi:hypothetical protein